MPDYGAIWDDLQKARQRRGIMTIDDVPGAGGSGGLDGMGTYARTPDFNPSANTVSTKMPAPINPENYRVKPVQTYEQWRGANPEQPDAHKGFWNRPKHGAKMGGIGALQAMASAPYGADTGEILGRGLGAFGAGAVAGGVKPEIADKYTYAQTVGARDQMRYEKEAKEANNRYEMDQATRKQAIGDMKVQGDLAKINADIQRRHYTQIPVWNPQTQQYELHVRDNLGGSTMMGAPANIMAQRENQNEQRLHDAWKTTQNINAGNWRTGANIKSREGIAATGRANQVGIAQMNNQGRFGVAQLNATEAMKRAQLRASGGGGGAVPGGIDAKTMNFSDWMAAKRQVNKMYEKVSETEMKQLYETQRR